MATPPGKKLTWALEEGPGLQPKESSSPVVVMMEDLLSSHSHTVGIHFFKLIVSLCLPTVADESKRHSISQLMLLFNYTKPDVVLAVLFACDMDATKKNTGN